MAALCEGYPSKMQLPYLMPYALCLLLLSSAYVRAAHQHVYTALLNSPPVLHLFNEDKPREESILLQSSSPEEYASYLTSIHDSLLENSFAQGTYQKLYSYTHLLNGFAALLTEEQAATLTSLPEVVLVERDMGVTTQTTHTPAYLGLPRGAWNDVGGPSNAGEGIVIGIVDTGIDPTHPSFADKTLKPYTNAAHYKGSCEVAVEFPKGSCNKKLVGAQHFAAAAIAKGKFNASIDFASPLDADGHGTHTASTAAGNSNVSVKVAGLCYGLASGMAPRAHIAAYKALYGFGGFNADVVAAIEQAVKDNVDILSLSIGVNSLPVGVATFFNVLDMAMFSATRAGVFIAHAAGNAGPQPQSTFSFSPWVFSVAASVHDRTYVNSMILGNGVTIQGTGLAPGTPGKHEYPLILARDALTNGSSTIPSTDGCQKASLFNESSVQGKLLICMYGLDFFNEDFTINKVARTVKKLSAAGVVMVLEEDLIGMFSIPVAPLRIPAIFISTQKDAETILEYYSNTTKFNASARIHGTKVKYSHEAPVVAGFSSRGPDTANDHLKIAEVLKPNIMAPGKMIWAAWSQTAKDSKAFRGQHFALLSGTSMATPHIAGIAALVKQKNPKLSPAALQSALMTTAYIVDKHGKPLIAENPSSNITLELGPATPFDYGAGAVNASAALDPGLIFDAGVEDYVMFLCTIPGAAEMVKNTTGMTCGKGEAMASSSSTTTSKSHEIVSSLSFMGGTTASLLSLKGDPKPSSPERKSKTTDLNLPSITIANLTSTYKVVRKVKSTGQGMETYRVKVVEPEGVEVAIKPMAFNIAPQETQELTISLTPAQAFKSPRFGHFILSGSHGHTVLSHISIVSAVVAAMEDTM